MGVHYKEIFVILFFSFVQTLLAEQLIQGFVNENDQTVNIYWLYDGNEQLIQTLDSGKTIWRPLDSTHTFLVRDASNSKLIDGPLTFRYEGVHVIRNPNSMTCAYHDDPSTCAISEPEQPSQHLLNQRNMNDNFRLKMNRDLPSIIPNFTEVGFAVMQVPEETFKLIKTYYENNKHQQALEFWPEDSIYVNHWESPTYMIYLPEEWSGSPLKTHIFEGLRPILEEWSGLKLKSTDLYGIRVYKNKSILRSHVDRFLTHVISAIINVDQIGIEEPWPLEIHDHNGKVHQVAIEPGQMILYESAKCIHGRPIPLRGHSFANCFIHFKPAGDWNPDYNY